jgi:hypothetical protein
MIPQTRRQGKPISQSWFIRTFPQGNHLRLRLRVVARFDSRERAANPCGSGEIVV